MAGEELAGSTVVDDELGPGMDRVETWPVSQACDQQNHTGPFAREGPLFGVSCSTVIALKFLIICALWVNLIDQWSIYWGLGAWVHERSHEQSCPLPPPGVEFPLLTPPPPGAPVPGSLSLLQPSTLS